MERKLAIINITVHVIPDTDEVLDSDGIRANIYDLLEKRRGSKTIKVATVEVKIKKSQKRIAQKKIIVKSAKLIKPSKG